MYILFDIWMKLHVSKRVTPVSRDPYLSKFASKSQTLLYLITKSLLLQFSAWVTLYTCPHGHFDGSPRSVLS